MWNGGGDRSLWSQHRCNEQMHRKPGVPGDRAPPETLVLIAVAFLATVPSVLSLDVSVAPVKTAGCCAKEQCHWGKLCECGSKNRGAEPRKEEMRCTRSTWACGTATASRVTIQFERQPRGPSVLSYGETEMPQK